MGAWLILKVTVVSLLQNLNFLTSRIIAHLELSQVLPRPPEINGRQEILNDAVLPIVHSAIPLLTELLIVTIIYIQP